MIGPENERPRGATPYIDADFEVIEGPRAALVPASETPEETWPEVIERIGHGLIDVVILGPFIVAITLGVYYVRGPLNAFVGWLLGV